MACACWSAPLAGATVGQMMETPTGVTPTMSRSPRCTIAVVGRRAGPRQHHRNTWVPTANVHARILRNPTARWCHRGRRIQLPALLGRWRILPDRRTPRPGRRRSAAGAMHSVSEGYFERWARASRAAASSQRSTTRTPLRCVVNESFARRYLADVDPVAGDQDLVDGHRSAWYQPEITAQLPAAT